MTTLAMVGVLIVAHFGGTLGASIVVLLFTLSAYPKTLTSVAGSPIPHVGIAAATPSLTTYSLALVVIIVGLFLRHGIPRSLWLWAPFSLWCCVALTTGWWPNTDEAWAGIFQLALAPLAWWVGCEAATGARNQPRIARVVVYAILAILIIQLAVASLQASGIAINPMPPANEALLGNRSNGTLSHPNDLGKIVLLLTAVSLPLFADRDGIRVSRRFFLLLILSFAILVLTGGRAVLIGSAATIILWFLLQPNTRAGMNRKFVVIGFSSVGALLVWMALAARFDEDPTGGARNQLSALALQQISMRPFIGTGPNSYVSIVGQFDPLTASGVPVHSSFLLAAAELGIPGAIAFALPFAVAVLRALRKTPGRTSVSAWSRSLIAVIPACVLIGATGWGLLGSYVLPLLSFMFGWLAFGEDHLVGRRLPHHSGPRATRHFVSRSRGL
ncbi:O-antigen ligase family protein [Microbacterium sp. SYP-A9085]|uniref:O-antigen ligase family protein n=1 Tax=Microbacterium sp. SYP-A9085 TaxID=2664454 RepID=UPI0015629C98